MAKDIKKIIKEFKLEINKAPIEYSNLQTSIFFMSPFSLQQKRINEKIPLPSREAKLEEEKLLRECIAKLKALDPSIEEVNATIDALQKVLEKHRNIPVHNFDTLRNIVDKKMGKICESHNTKNGEAKRKVLLEFANNYASFAKKFNLDKYNQEKDIEK